MPDAPTFVMTSPVKDFLIQILRIMTRLLFIAIFLLSFTAHLPAQDEAIPFQMAGKLILVQAKIGSISGNFILDTGTSHLVLNAKYYSGSKIDKVFSGVNGEINQLEADYFDVQLGAHRWKSCYAEIMPLGHLERAKFRKIHGLIGSRLLRKFRLFIDYRASHLRLEKQEKTDSDQVYHLDPADLTYSFRYKGDTPCIQANLAGHEVKLAIDTGAEINLFDQKLSRRFHSFLQEGKRRNLSSFSSQTQNRRASKMVNLSVESSQLKPMNTLFISLSDWNSSTAGPRVDAILGFEFLVQFQIEINYQTKEIRFWHQQDPKAMAGTANPSTDRSR